MTAPTKPAPSAWWTCITGVTAFLVAVACGIVLWSFVPPVVFFVYFVLAGWALLILGAVRCGAVRCGSCSR